MALFTQLRGRANRRVAYVTSGSQKAVQPPLELPCVKSCAPIGASSKHLYGTFVGARSLYTQRRISIQSCSKMPDSPAPIEVLQGDSRLMGTGLCRILQTNFAEFLFHAFR